MKRRLFWKILVGFWITYLAIAVGVWLLFAAYAPTQRAQNLEFLRRVGQMQVSSAALALRTGGQPALDNLLAAWPAGARGNLKIQRLHGPADARSGPVGQVEQVVLASDGWRRIVFNYAPPPRSRAVWFIVPLPVLFVEAVGGLLFSAILAAYLTRPIDRLRGGFERLASGDLAVRLEADMGRRRDEIADLARDFDLMAEQLQRLVASRDQLLHDVSHELRSPLARLNMAIGLARQNPARIEPSLDRIEFESHRLDALVGELLSLSRMESGADHLDAFFDIVDLIRTIVDDARFEGQSMDVSVRTNVDALSAEASPPTLKGDPEILRRGLENIVRNALRHSAKGQSVAVDLAFAAARGVLTIEVRDDGPGVPEEGLRTMFEPFIRMQQGASRGYGLGLAIARRAIQAHGGTVEARNRVPSGLAVIVVLPLR